jgi:group I intron endonuclease
MASGIYCIENKINGKKYIGQSKDIDNRFMRHKSDFFGGRNHSPILMKAWEKYGRENFNFYTIVYLPNIKIIMDAFEIFFIWLFNSHVSRFGYNISWGGNTPMKNRKHSEETKRKISKNNPKHWKNKKRPAETIEKIRLSKIGKKATIRTKEKMGDSHRGKKQINGITSLFIGVYKRNDNGKFRSEIKFKGKRYKLGTFKTEEEAAKAYDIKYMELNNTDTAPNFPKK